MRGKNYTKIGSLIGLVLAEIYMVFVVLGPNDHPHKTSRMLIPESMMPRIENIAPGTPPPLSVKVTRLMVGSVLFGLFGALVGLGGGLLVTGLTQKTENFSEENSDDSKS